MTNERRMLVRTPGNPWSAPDVTGYENENHLQEILAAQPTWIPGVSGPALTALELPTLAGPIDVCIVGADAASPWWSASWRRTVSGAGWWSAS